MYVYVPTSRTPACAPLSSHRTRFTAVHLATRMNKPAPTDPRPGADLPPTDPRPLRVRTRRWTVRCPICSGSRPAQPVPDRTVATGGNHVLEINHPALLSPTSPGPHRTRESSRASVCVFQELLRPWSVYVTCSIRRSAGPRPGKDESSLARHEGHHEHGVGAGLARGGGRTKNGFEPAAWPASPSSEAKVLVA